MKLFFWPVSSFQCNEVFSCSQFLGAVMDRDMQLASRLCQMSVYPASVSECLPLTQPANGAFSALFSPPVLLHEPDNPEARQFLPLIQEKLLEGINKPHPPLV